MQKIQASIQSILAMQASILAMKKESQASILAMKKESSASIQRIQGSIQRIQGSIQRIQGSIQKILIMKGGYDFALGQATLQKKKKVVKEINLLDLQIPEDIQKYSKINQELKALKGKLKHAEKWMKTAKKFEKVLLKKSPKIQAIPKKQEEQIQDDSDDSNFFDQEISIFQQPDIEEQPQQIKELQQMQLQLVQLKQKLQEQNKENQDKLTLIKKIIQELQEFLDKFGPFDKDSNKQIEECHNKIQDLVSKAGIRFEQLKDQMQEQ